MNREFSKDRGKMPKKYLFKMFIITSNWGNVSQNNFEVLSYPIQNGKDQQNDCGQMQKGVLRVRVTHSQLMGLHTGAATIKVSVDNSQEAKDKSAI